MCRRDDLEDAAALNSRYKEEIARLLATDAARESVAAAAADKH